MATLVPALNGSTIDPNGNTYVTLEEASAYFEGRENGGAWLELGEDAQKVALLDVIDILDALRWIGGPVQEIQPLAWPRLAIRPIERRSRRPIRTGFETLSGATSGLYDARQRFWASTAIPIPIKNAQCALAFAQKINDFNFNLEAEIKSLTDDKVSVTLDRPQKKRDLPESVMRLVAPFIMSGPEPMRG